MGEFTAAAGRDPRPGLGEGERRALLAEAVSLAEVCREAIAGCRRGGLEVATKPDRSLVTSADRGAEQAFRAAALGGRPQVGVIGEEYGRVNPEAALQWVIDPIDGTAEFAAGLPLWGTIIGLYLEGWPLAGVIDHPDLGVRAHAGFGLGAYLGERRLVLADLPAGDLDGRERLGLPSRAGFMRYRDEGECFERLTRAYPNCRTFHTCYAHLLAASGGLDAALEWEVRIWDLAATRILVEEAGGRYLTLASRDQPGVGAVHSAAFGRPRLVEAIAGLLG